MLLEKIVLTFLKEQKPIEKPLLLGFSGGEDSLTLAHCLKQLKIPFHLAHFDHGWREKSAAEAQKLQEWADEQNIPFHTKRSTHPEKNELAAREERFEFFKNLFETDSFHALVLAHHQLDQTETILKRVFEGAHLTTLKGIQPLAARGAMPIWRPLLEVSKECIRAYLQTWTLTPIDDETNRDSKYLRARMRQNLLPTLSKEFGKEIAPSLNRLGKYSTRLEDYLTEKTAHFKPIEGLFGTFWDFSEAHPVEISFVLRQVIPSHSLFERIFQALEKGAANHRIAFSKNVAIIDRGRLFILKENPPQFPQKVPLQEGTIHSELWEWKISFSEKVSEAQSSTSHWEEWWKGKISLALPKGNYDLAPADSSFRKRWNAQKIPAFLRDSLPIVMEKGKPVGQFFTESPNATGLQISIVLVHKNANVIH
ncbi:MAG: tRNA(Ile)-lysidine synthase [Chlamydiae bacterium]|nr:tRNA(Ile)-lysidine synthase [Chlamydiota bacterium]